MSRGNFKILQLNSDLDGHLVFLSSGETAMETRNGNTIVRLQLDKGGNVTLYQSTDGGSTWPKSKIIASIN